MSDVGNSSPSREGHLAGEVAGGPAADPSPGSGQLSYTPPDEPGLKSEDPTEWINPTKWLRDQLPDDADNGDLTPVISVPPSPDDDGEPDRATAQDSNSTGTSDSTTDSTGASDSGDSAADDDADGSAGPDGGGGCFVAGTPVHTGDGGTVAIEDVALDAKLASCDVASGVAAVGTVTRRFEAISAEVVTVAFADEALRCTARHRFFTTSGWRAAGKLAPGTEVRCLDGAARTVVAVSAGQAETAVFNLRVDWQHTYYVGEAGYLVHNEKDRDNGDAASDGIPDGSVDDKV
jgi:Pretoxin HINT domain